MSNKVFQLLGEIIINYSKSEIDQATQDAKKLKEELEGIETNADEAGDAIKATGDTGSTALGENSKIGKATIWLGNAMYDITLKAMNLGKQLISAGMEYNAAMEGYETNFTTLLGGDSERAKQLVKDLEVLAAETPLDTAQTAKAAQDLLIYGTAVDDVIDTLKMMGDITLGNADRMGRFALAYNQMLGKGKLMAQEQNQMTEAAVPIVDIVLDHLGLTREAYEDMREQGLLAASDVKDALFAATQSGGQFYNGMARTMETYQGQTQRAAEIGNKTAGKLFEPFFEVYKSDVLPQLTTTLENIYNWAEENQGTLRGFAESLGKIANFALSPNWDSFMTATLTTWDKTVKPSLEKAMSLTIGVDIQFPTIGEVHDKFQNWIAEMAHLPEANWLRIGDKSLSDLMDEYNRAKESGLGAGSKNKSGGTDWDNLKVIDITGKETTPDTYGSIAPSIPEFPLGFGWSVGGGTSGGGSSGGSSGGRTQRSLDTLTLFAHDNSILNNNDYLAQAITQMNSNNNDNSSQMISLLTAILAATNRPIVLNTGDLVGGLSGPINTRLGRDFTQSVRRW